MVVSVDANVHSVSLFAIDLQRSMALRLAQEKCVESFVECVSMSKQSLIFIYHDDTYSEQSFYKNDTL